jgi:8-oxo-dGTP pyrophosphatase MutT (NUDIX family)
MPSLAEQLRPLLLSEEEAAALDVRGRIDAAVLVALYELDGELHAVFTRRRDDMRRHAGEISFPGGRQDVDEEDLRDTALRETEEEIGLPRDAVHLAGALAPTPTVVTSYAIHPFVGTIEPGRRWRPSAAEVAEVLELTLPQLLEGHSRKRLIRRGVPFRTDVYETGGHLIWGATARILSDLFERLEPLLRDGGRGRPASGPAVRR